MSTKRPKSESDEDSEPLSDDKSCKRKPEELSVDDLERNELKRFEDKYINRYTEEDPEYRHCVQTPDSEPPILTNYFGKRGGNRDRFRGYDRRRGDDRGRGYGHNSRGRDGYQQRQSYSDHRRSNWNSNPYNRY